MIALFLNGQPELLAPKHEVEKRINSILNDNPNADLQKAKPSSCSACGTLHFDEKEALHCGCLDY